jgi:hypothetical protein
MKALSKPAGWLELRSTLRHKFPGILSAQAAKSTPQATLHHAIQKQQKTTPPSTVS